VSRPERAWRWCRGKPVVASLGTATVLLLLAVAIGSPIAMFRIDRARQIALREKRRAQDNAYAAHMKGAKMSRGHKKRGPAVGLLNRYWPAGGEEDLRGVEWRYLWQAARGDERHTWQHPAPVAGARFSPGGSFVVSHSFDGFLRVWDVASRNPIATLKRGAS